MHTTPMRGGRSFLSEEEKQNKPEITVALLKRIFSYLRPYWKQLGLTLLAIVVSSVFGILPTLLTGRIIDDGLINRDLGMLVTLIIISLVVLVYPISSGYWKVTSASGWRPISPVICATRCTVICRGCRCDSLRPAARATSSPA